MKLSRRFWVPAGAAAALLALALHHPPAGRADDVGDFQNVKKLQSLSKEDFYRRMKEFCSALGVNCDKCHLRDDYASDEKPEKRKARQMLDVVDTLNAQFFNQPEGPRATCYLCHRGAEKPQTAP